MSSHFLGGELVWTVAGITSVSPRRPSDQVVGLTSSRRTVSKRDNDSASGCSPHSVVVIIEMAARKVSQRAATRIYRDNTSRMISIILSAPSCLTMNATAPAARACLS